MEPEMGKIRCQECGDWVPVEESDDFATCSCGQQVIVTITQMPGSSV